MAQAKKKTATKTASKPTKAPAKKVATKKTCKKNCEVSRSGKIHVCIITGMVIMAYVLLCATVLMVSQ